ncbi:hypothetical protein BDV18DRAFT_35884 [Aspergillus unguis]
MAQDAVRAKRQLDALLEFVKGRDGSSQTKWEFRKSSSTTSPTSPLTDGSAIDQLSISDVAPSDGPLSPKASPRRESLLDPIPQLKGATGQQPLDRYETFDVYSRASSALVSGMDADGVLFLNAPRINSRNSSRRSSCVISSGMNGRPQGAPFHRRFSIQSTTEEQFDKPCEMLGSAFSAGDGGDRGDYSTSLTQALVDELFTSFPEGDIINSVAAAKFDIELDRSIENRLLKTLPDAQCILFLPIWDWDKSRGIAGILMWKRQGDFLPDDLHYVRAFSDAIVSDLAQIDRRSTARSQHDLLSSVSHELRTPLHGMLANSELLQSTSLEPSQREMIKTVKTCAETLLGTMNHLLAYAKINNFTTHRLSTESATEINDMTTPFDLDEMIEDVADSFYAGHQLQNNSSKFNRQESAAAKSTTPKAVHTQDSTSAGPLSVIVRIEGRQPWRIRGISGAWRRIIMSVLGNAFKFTRSGLIEVTLAEAVGRNGLNARYAHITVTDTGCGISPDYLRNKLFTPFTQEHILTEGVGLGLSIAQQLIEQFGGNIDITSEIGAGTKVDIRIPVEFSEDRNVKTTDSHNPFPNRRVCLVSLAPSLKPEGLPQRSATEARRKSAINDAMSSIFQSHRWEQSHAKALHCASGDIAVLEESTLHGLSVDRPVRTACRSLLVLRDQSPSSSATISFSTEIPVVYVSQPFGPRQIRQALEKLENLNIYANTKARPRLILPANSIRERRSSVASAAAHGLASPPAVRDSVSDYISAPVEPSRQDLHVLVVDDNDINLRLLSGFMDKIGCTYGIASNGLEAFEKYKEAQPRFGFVLMDISMPVMDGITAARAIRDYEDELSLPPAKVMAVTAVASNEMQDQAADAGMDEYLVKPLALHELKRIMGVS